MHDGWEGKGEQHIGGFMGIKYWKGKSCLQGEEESPVVRVDSLASGIKQNHPLLKLSPTLGSSNIQESGLL